jgi:hypothetical protein
MSNRVEYSCLTLLLVAAIGASLFYEPNEGTQDSHEQQSTVAPDSAQQFVTYNSRGDRLPQASRVIDCKKILPLA